MDASQSTQRERWRSLGLEDTHAAADATLRLETGMPEAPAERRDANLPRISVDLRRTLPLGAVAASGTQGGPELEILDVLGEGGMGCVYLAKQRSLDRVVAIKTLRDDASRREFDALVAEATVTGHLEHPSIIPVHALGLHDDGRPILVMKRVDGVSWDELLADPRHPSWEAFGGSAENRLEDHLEIFGHVCNAVHFAHSRGFVHRDVKPQNVLIGRYGEVYLADWGIATRITGEPTHRIAGTPSFMAPELVRGDAADERTDVYLLGATLHFILTGEVRHAGVTMFDVLERATASAPHVYPSSVPPALAALANRATARDPSDRPASAAELRRAIADYRRHESSLALTASALPRLARLREVLDAGGEAAQREADGLFAETRFALERAVEDWRENAEAAAALADLDRLLAARQARTAALEKIARDHDPRVSARSRAATMIAAGCTAAAILLAAALRGPSYVPTADELFRVSLVPVLVLATAVIVLRRQLAESAVNRQIAVALLAAASAISLNRAVGLHAGTGAASIIAHDAIVAGALAAFSSVTLPTRVPRVVALAMLVTALGCALFPAYANFGFSLTSACILVLAPRVTWRGGPGAS